MGPAAADIAWLWWVILILGTIVYVAVMAALAVPLLRSRRTGGGSATVDGPDEGHAEEPGDDPRAGDRQPAPGRLTRPPGASEDEPLALAPDARRLDVDADRRTRGRLLWLGGVILPAIILVVLLVVGAVVSRSVAHIEQDGELVVDVTGHSFWWEVHYPELDVTTANEVHVPIDRPVRLRLHTEDVIHSFWVPRVHGKADMIPGTENWLSFTVEEPGRYRGQCAEYCGIAHAQMAKFLVAEEPDDFEAWVAEQREPADEPETEAAQRGQQAFFEYGCADCHGVDGHGATGPVGPDLTHLASRGSLAAGIVDNDRDNLEELIVDPWSVKAGNPMPPTAIEGDDLEDLLDYLEGLE